MKRLLYGTAIGIGLVFGTTLGSALAVPKPESPQVTICHAAPADEWGNWVEITIDANGTVLSSQHQTQHDADIIPPFEYDEGSYPGKNWTAEGQAVYNNECSLPEPTATATATPTNTEEPSATPTNTEEPTATPTATVERDTDTPTPTATDTVTDEPTPTDEPTATPTDEATPTFTPTPTFDPCQGTEFVECQTPTPEPTPTKPPESCDDDIIGRMFMLIGPKGQTCQLASFQQRPDGAWYLPNAGAQETCCNFVAVEVNWGESYLIKRDCLTHEINILCTSCTGGGPDEVYGD